MRIAIDATQVPANPAGAGVYAIELVRAMAQRDRHNGYALFARGDWADTAVPGRRNWRIERVGARSRPARLAWEQARLPAALNRLGIDVVHSTHHTLPLRPLRARRVVTVHDVTFFRIPERYPPVRRAYMQTLTRLSAKVADAIIVPSRSARDDVLRALPVSESKISVVYEAPGPQYVPVARETAAAIARRYAGDGPYVLSVGSREPGKNRPRLIAALRALRDEGLDYRLLVVGQGAWRSDEDLAAVREQGMDGRVTFAGYVPAEHLPALYSGAVAFAFPSLHEGFGLPVLEAMSCGAPVLTSGVSATAEVSGGAALLVDPLSVASIRDGLRRLLNDAALRERLSAAGRARAATFTWARAADETHAVYERALHPDPRQ